MARPTPSSRPVRPDASGDGPDVSVEPASPTVRSAYDGSTALYRGLRKWGWNPLMNLGYFPLASLPLLILGLGPFQRRLARESLRLLAPRAGERILDVACGRGWTAQKIHETGARVVGLDLVEAHLRDAARTRPGPVALVRGDARSLPFASGTFDGLHLLEAGFQLGPEGRARFLAEAARVLAPGGRLVLVDLVWRDDRPDEIDQVDVGRAVRDTWSFEEFEPLERYRERARAVGLVERTLVDWTRPVLDRFQLVGNIVTRLGLHAGTRWLLTQLRPAFKGVPTEDWIEVRRVVQGHSRVRERSRYVALVFDKPR